MLDPGVLSQLPRLLGPALRVEDDHPALGPRPERGGEGLVEILLGDRHLAHELLEGHRGPDDVLDVVLQRHLVVARDAFQPGGGVGGAVGAAESHRLGAAGDLRVDVGLRDRELALGEGLPEERAGDQDLEHVEAVAVEAGLPHALNRHRDAVDQRGDAGHRRGPGGIVDHVLDPRRLLQPAEHPLRGLAAGALPQLLEEPRPDLVEGHAGGRQVPLALDDDELVGDLDDRRDPPDGQPEGHGFEARFAGVAADRLHPPVGAGAADVDGVLPGQGAEIVRTRFRLAQRRSASAAVRATMIRAFTAGPNWCS